ncbi:MAG TPA: stage IV sporulation protein A [Clostridia bacterium]|nr:stage IV sporulation protein A [Clostridia bacterium]
MFYKVLGETTGLEINGEGDLIETMMGLSKMKKEYDKIKDALDEVNARVIVLNISESARNNISDAVDHTDTEGRVIG